MTTGVVSNRQANLDLLRGICALFVVFEHFCEYGAHNAFGFTEETSIIAHLVLRLIYGVARTAVPVFFLLSGYLSVYSSKQRVGKVINLFFMVCMYSLLRGFYTVAVSLLRGQSNISCLGLLRSAFPVNYYLYLYCGLYVVSPFINVMITTLSKKNCLRLIIILLFVFSLWSTLINTVLGFLDSDQTGVYFTSRTGTSMGFNIANFTMLYIIGGFLRLYYVRQKTRRDIRVSIVIILLSTIITSIAKIYIPAFSKALWYYDSVFIVVSSIAIMVLFLNIEIKPNRIITFVGVHTFGTFLIHGLASTCIESVISIEEVVSKGIVGTFIGIVVFVLGTYILALFLTTILEWIAKPLNHFWKETKLYNYTFMLAETDN